MQLEGVAAYQEEDGRNMTEEEFSEPSSSTPHDIVGLTPDPVLSDWSVEYSPKSKRNS